MRTQFTGTISTALSRAAPPSRLRATSRAWQGSPMSLPVRLMSRGMAHHPREHASAGVARGSAPGAPHLSFESWLAGNGLLPTPRTEGDGPEAQ